MLSCTWVVRNRARQVVGCEAFAMYIGVVSQNKARYHHHASSSDIQPP
jgi:predicted GIY-YIG superfamily endonuclease